LPGEDFQMFEKDLPGNNTTGFGGASVSALPLETCETMNNSWGYNITDVSYKSGEGSYSLHGECCRAQCQFSIECRSYAEWRNSNGIQRHIESDGKLVESNTEKVSAEQRGNIVPATGSGV
jgi:hypothetical protein